MSLPFSDISWLGVLAAFVVNTAIGFAWFSPLLFLKLWQSYLPEESKKGGSMARAMILGFGSTLIGLIVMALLFAMFGVNTIAPALVLAFLFWLGFVMPIQMSTVAWENRKLGLFFINTSQMIVSLLASAAVYAWIAY